MIHDDDNAPATKGDLRRVRAELDQQFKEQREQINEDFTQALAVSNEQLVHDFTGIFNDRTEQHTDKLTNHKERIDRVETHLGLPKIA